ncbi:MAG: hypothetical protein CMJ70_07400 [Planctomycetaceae bacterium]|jgi:hypothetical protein|nr:hypothetical protein [Planctomycetaceae bacterium]
MSFFCSLSHPDSCLTFRRALAYLLVVALLPTITAPAFGGVVSRLVNESESPFESGEESEEPAAERRANELRRFRLRSGQRQIQTAGQRVVRALHVPPPVTRRIDGHRLPNGLLAPLTC